MSNAAVEIVPLTDDQVAAIKSLRFCYTNLDRSVAFGLTLDREVAERCPGGVTAVTKSRDPKVVEYDVMMGHPHAVALVVELQEKRSKA